MLQLQNHREYCPYCGEPIELLLDCSVEQQDYIEDCTVCCRPIALSVHVDATGVASVAVRHEND